MGKLDGKIALITGGTSGIGEASAKLFAEEGATVIVVGRNVEKGNRVADEIREKNGEAMFFSCDVTEEQAVKELKKQVLEAYGHVDILFNNVGILITSALEDIQLSDWNKTFDVNVKATMLMTNDSIPMGRVGKTKEIAKVALFFVSDDASYVTGAVVPVDGGAALM